MSILGTAGCGSDGATGGGGDGGNAGTGIGGRGNQGNTTGMGNTGNVPQGGGGGVIDPNLNSDGACMTDAQEVQAGTDPYLADTDGDGVDDCAELDCVSNPTDPAEKCYACGWKHKDPGNVQSTGTGVGSVMGNFTVTDQCGEQVDIHDFYGSYHILYHTAAW